MCQYCSKCNSDLINSSLCDFLFDQRQNMLRLRKSFGSRLTSPPRPQPALFETTDHYQNSVLIFCLRASNLTVCMQHRPWFVFRISVWFCQAWEALAEWLGQAELDLGVPETDSPHTWNFDLFQITAKARRREEQNNPECLVIRGGV